MTKEICTKVHLNSKIWCHFLSPSFFNAIYEGLLHICILLKHCVLCWSYTTLIFSEVIHHQEQRIFLELFIWRGNSTAEWSWNARISCLLLPFGNCQFMKFTSVWNSPCTFSHQADAYLTLNSYQMVVVFFLMVLCCFSCRFFFFFGSCGQPLLETLSMAPGNLSRVPLGAIDFGEEGKEVVHCILLDYSKLPPCRLSAVELCGWTLICLEG